MKVVRIIARLNVGGPARHVAWLTSATQQAGIESLLVAGTLPHGEDDMTHFATAQGVVPVIVHEMSREISLKDAVTVWKLFRLFRRECPDIVHTHTAKAGTVGRIAGWFYHWTTPAAKCRFVHTYHGHIFHSYYGSLKTKLFLTIEKMLARMATDRIVVISPQQYREIHEQFGVGRAAQFSVIPLGLDTKVFADWAARRDAARARLGAEDGDILVGIVGRLTEIKNHQLFLEAIARFRDERGTRGARVRFIIIGDGHLRRDLETQARALGVREWISFTGLRDDPENFYAALDVVALTSLNEGTPLTLIEAMANARAVVATAVGGVVDLVGEPVEAAREETVGEGGAGYTVCERGISVRPRDRDAFSRALLRLVEDGELRRAMGARGRMFVETNYSKERLVADVLSLYEELLNPARGRTDDETRSSVEAPQGVAPVARAARLKGD